MEDFTIPTMWDGYCPESKLLHGNKVRMRLNGNDFYESEETGLQICAVDAVQVVILNFRGEGEFRQTPQYGDEIANGQMLSPQNTDRFPFNDPTVIFENVDEVKEYIQNIK